MVRFGAINGRMFGNDEDGQWFNFNILGEFNAFDRKKTTDLCNIMLAHHIGLFDVMKWSISFIYSSFAQILSNEWTEICGAWIMYNYMI